MGALSILAFIRRNDHGLTHHKPARRNVYMGIALALIYLMIKAAQIFAREEGNITDNLDEQAPYTVAEHSPKNMHIFDLESVPPTDKKYDMSLPWAVVYSPLTPEGECKPAQEISEDFKHISKIGIERVRLFSLDCGVLDVLEPVKSLNAILGLYVEDSEDLINEDDVNVIDVEHRKRHGDKAMRILKLLYEQMSSILASPLDLNSRIDMLVVGTDNGIQDGHYSKAELVKMLRFVKLTLPNYSGHITVSEPVESYISANRFNAINAESYHEFEDNEDLCSEVDAIGLSIQPYFNSAMDPASVSHLVQRDVRFAKFVCSDNFIGSSHKTANTEHVKISTPVAVLQAGWPSSGDTNGNAVASLEEQQVAVEELISTHDADSNQRIPIALYSYNNDLWRDAGLLHVENSFGISHLYS